MRGGGVPAGLVHPRPPRWDALAPSGCAWPWLVAQLDHAESSRGPPPNLCRLLDCRVHILLIGICRSKKTPERAVGLTWRQATVWTLAAENTNRNVFSLIQKLFHQYQLPSFQNAACLADVQHSTYPASASLECASWRLGRLSTNIHHDVQDHLLKRCFRRCPSDGLHRRHNRMTTKLVAARDLWSVERARP